MSSLDESLIRQSLALADARLESLQLLASVGSTNDHLLGQAPPAPGTYRVAIADEQTAGRGRHGRKWLSPPGAGLWMSLACTFAKPPKDLPALTLAVGAAIVDALAALGIDGIKLKWPNDLVALDGKLGGILTEARASGAGISVVTGVGINIELPADAKIEADSDWAGRITGLAALAPGLPGRERLAAALIDALAEAMQRFERNGFADYLRRWCAADWLQGRAIVVEHDGGTAEGIAAGVAADGALLLERGGETLRISSGSVVLAERREAAL